MDIVHHALIGGAGFLVAATHQQELAGAAFLAGSVFPDLDVVFMAFGKRAYLRNHQGITHSLPLSPLYALLIAWPLLVLTDNPWPVYLGALLGLWVHMGLDLTNTFRIGLFSPLTRRRFSLDAVFFIDACALVLTGLFYASYLWLGMDWVAWAYPLSFAAYVAFKVALVQRVRRSTGGHYAIPSSLNPFAFYLLERVDSGATTCLYNALTGNRSRTKYYRQVPERYTQLADSSALYDDVRAVTRALSITSVDEDETGTTIVASDLAVRNFGGRFGQTRLRFARDGKLIHEAAEI